MRPPAPATAAERERTATRQVDISIDGTTVRVPEGWTILEACRAQGIETPTLCYLESLTPVNVCRVCVVEVEGSRVLVPACSRKVEPKMIVKTDSARVRLTPQDGPRVPGLVGGPVAGVGGDQRVHRALRREPGALRRAGATGSRGRARSRPSRPSRRRRRRHGGRRRAAGQGGQRAVRARLLQVHPLLQVRRGVRRRCPEHLRDLGGGPRLRRPHLHGVRGPAAGTRPASTVATASASARRAR